MVTKELAGRIYAIGDVHGHATRLRALHERIRQDLRAQPAASLLIHLGDLIDRGPDSAACLECLLSDPNADTPTINMMANPERMLLDALERPQRAPLWLQNGGAATLASWDIDPRSPPETWRERIPAAQLRLLQRLALCHLAPPFLFVHAGVRPGIRLSMQSPHDLLWIREDFLHWSGTMLPELPDTIVVHGHTPTPEPQLRRNRIGIDTNAGSGGKLTCAALEQDSVYFLQV